MFMDAWKYFPAVAVFEYYQKVGAIFKGRRGERRKQILDNLKERRRYWNLKEESLDHTCEELNVDEHYDLSQDNNT
jgi:hypothetical protein